MARRTAKQIAASRRNLIKARAKRKAKAPRVTNRRTYSGGIAYNTRSSRGVINRKTITHMTYAYKRHELVGYGMSKTKKGKSEFQDLYVDSPYRGKGVSRKILLHQARATKGTQVAITGLRSVGGTKVANRTKIRGVNPTINKQKGNPAEVNGIMEFTFAMQHGAHSKHYRKQQKRALKARVQGRKIQAKTRRAHV
jgi:GNAT superfamily N-acetyltransferase